MAKRTWLLVWMMVWIRSIGSMPDAGIQLPAAQAVRCARRGDTKPMQHAEYRYLDQVNVVPSAGDREGGVSSLGKTMASTSTISGSSSSSSREVAESADGWNEDGREAGAEHEQVFQSIRGENPGADLGRPPRVCESCQGKRVSKGVEGPGRTWQSFFCRRCSVIHKGKGLMGLYRRCTDCTRWAVFGRLRGRVEHCREHKRLGEVDVLHVYKDGRSNMNDFGDACSVPGAGDEDGAIHCESRPRDDRLCDVCRQCSARFGVADEALDGAWSRLMCRQCSNSYIPQNASVLLALVQRCLLCRKYAVFGPRSDAASPGRERLRLRCSNHRLRDDVDNLHQRCQFEACSTIPSFGPSSTGRPVHCALHKATGDIYLRLGRCRHEMCPNKVSGSHSDRCIGHGGTIGARLDRNRTKLDAVLGVVEYAAPPQLETVANLEWMERSEETHVDEQVAEGVERRGDVGWHGSRRVELSTEAASMRRLGHAWKCEFPEGCHRVAFFMLTKKSRDRTSTAKFCREHCESVSMPIELRKRRRCMTVGCDRQASQALFAYDASHSDLRANWCTEHAPDGSINVVSSRCTFQGCRTIASFGHPHEGSVRRCRLHSVDGDVDLRNRRCEASQGCTRRATNKVANSGIMVRCCTRCAEALQDQGTRRCR